MRTQFANSVIQKYARAHSASLLTYSNEQNSPLAYVRLYKYNGSSRQYRSTVFPSDPYMASVCFQQADAIMQRWIITERLLSICSAACFFSLPCMRSSTYRDRDDRRTVCRFLIAARDTIVQFVLRRGIYGSRQFHEFDFTILFWQFLPIFINKITRMYYFLKLLILRLYTWHIDLYGFDQFHK